MNGNHQLRMKETIETRNQWKSSLHGVKWKQRAQLIKEVREEVKMREKMKMLLYTTLNSRGINEFNIETS